MSWTLYVDAKPEEHADEEAVLIRLQRLVEDALRQAGIRDVTVKDDRGMRHEVHLDVRLEPVRT